MCYSLYDHDPTYCINFPFFFGIKLAEFDILPVAESCRRGEHKC